MPNPLNLDKPIEVIRTAQFAPFLNEWVERHNVEHPRNEGKAFQFDPNRVYGIGGVRYLANEIVEMTGKSVGHCEKMIREVRNCKNEYTSVMHIDEIITVMERPDLWVHLDVIKIGSMTRKLLAA